MQHLVELDHVELAATALIVQLSVPQHGCNQVAKAKGALDLYRA